MGEAGEQAHVRQHSVVISDGHGKVDLQLGEVIVLAQAAVQASDQSGQEERFRQWCEAGELKMSVELLARRGRWGFVHSQETALGAVTDRRGRDSRLSSASAASLC